MLSARVILISGASRGISHAIAGRLDDVIHCAGVRHSFRVEDENEAPLALTHATRNTARDDGVRTTAICPSRVNTGMALVSGLAPQAMAQPEDIAQRGATVLIPLNTAHVNELTVNCSLEV